MKYQSSNTKHVFDINFDTTRKAMYICPECSSNRKKSKSKDLEFYTDTQRAYCFHCNTTFFEYKPYETEKQYVVPEWKNKTELTDKAVKYFEGRMISQKTLNACKVYSDIEWMPQFKKEIEVICFPFFRGDKLINTKFRGAKKSFKLVSGAELIWWNCNEIEENENIIICEGEIDGLTFVENGFKNVISVPNGANNNLEYLDNSIEAFESINKIYLATDTDTKGIELRDELIRRFGAEVCFNVNFKDCKDANEYFIKYGGFEFKMLLKEATPVPVKGNVEISSLYSEIVDLYENGLKEGSKISIEEIDKYCTWELGRLAVVTGIPSCFTKNQLVITNNGNKEISKLNIGDKVLSYDERFGYNKFRSILNTSVNKNTKDKIYRITMNDGTIIECTENHLFYTGTSYMKIKDLLLPLDKFKNVDL